MQWRPLAARLELESRLLANANIRLDRTTARLEGKWNMDSRQGRQRLDRSRLQLPPLRARDARDERQMVILATLGRAVRLPMTDLAMLDGIRIVLFRDPLVAERDRGEHLTANQTEVGGVVVDAIRANCRERVWRDDVKSFR